MEEIISKLTDTELLKVISDISSKHEIIKKESLELIDKYDNNIIEMSKLEDEYVLLISELTKRSQ